MRGVRQVVLATLLALLLATSAVRAATQADACDPAGADGCPLAFHSDMRALLKQGTDLHTYRLAIPAAGRFLVTASPANRPDSVLDLQMVDPDGGPLVSAGDGRTTETTGFVAPKAGEYRVLVQVNPARDRNVLAVPYYLNAYPSAAIGRLLPSAQADAGRG